MKNWLRHTKKACILAFCAAVIPAGYQNLRTLAGWPRPQAAEGIIPDSLIVKKQSFEMAVEQKAALSRRSSFSQWNSFPDSAENGRPGTVITTDKTARRRQEITAHKAARRRRETAQEKAAKILPGARQRRAARLLQEAARQRKTARLPQRAAQQRKAARLPLEMLGKQAARLLKPA